MDNQGQEVNLHKRITMATPLYTAACQQDLSLVSYLLENGAKAEHGTIQESPLHKACSTKDINLCRILLSAGANPNILDSQLCSPLWRAVQHSAKSLVDILLQHGADCNMGCKDTQRDHSFPLLLAVKNRCYDIVLQLVTFGANVNLRDWFGETALQRASRLDEIPLITLLIGAGANVDACDKDNKTALYEACWRGKEQVVRLLLQNGANPNIQRTDSWCHHLFTPLHIAVTLNHVDVIRLLLREKRTDVCKKDHCERTPFMLACELGCTKAALLLLERPEFDINDIDVFKNSSLIQAANTGNSSLLLTLVHNPSCNVNLQGASAKTALHLLAQKSATSSIEALLNRGACFTATDSAHNTPIFYSITVYDQDSVMQFVQHGFPWCNSDLQNMRFMQLITQKYRVNILKCLIRLGWRPIDFSTSLLIQYLIKMEHDTETIGWMQSQLRNALPLSFICRNAIRNILVIHSQGCTIENFVLCLPLPPALKHFISFT